MTAPPADSAPPPPGSAREPLAGLRAALEATVSALAPSDGQTVPAPTLERPKRAEFGDYSTNGALLLAPRVGAPPRELAERLGAAVAERLGADLDRYDVAGPGFVNLFMSDGWCRRALAAALAAGPRFGGGGAAPAE